MLKPRAGSVRRVVFDGRVDSARPLLFFWNITNTHWNMLRVRLGLRKEIELFEPMGCVSAVCRPVTRPALVCGPINRGCIDVLTHSSDLARCADLSMWHQLARSGLALLQAKRALSQCVPAAL
jgi:hypothetical protein